MTDRDLELRLLIACAVAREAGHLAYDYFIKRDQLDVEHKGVQDLVERRRPRGRGADPHAPRRRLPRRLMLGEEGGGEACPAREAANDLLGDEDESKKAAPGLWIIDPIDGTANFLRGMPYWSVALAYWSTARPRSA